MKPPKPPQKNQDLADLELSDLELAEESFKKRAKQEQKLKKQALEAYKINDIESFSALIDANLSLAFDPYGDDHETLLHMACREGKLEFIEYLYGKVQGSIFNEGPREVSILDSQGNAHTIEVGKKRMPEIPALPGEDSVLDRKGNTPLLAACKAGKLEAVKYILAKGEKAELGISDKERNSPLHIAYQMGSVAMVKALHEKGANKESRNNDGKLPHELVEKKFLYKLTKLEKEEKEREVKKQQEEERQKEREKEFLLQNKLEELAKKYGYNFPTIAPKVNDIIKSKKNKKDVSNLLHEACSVGNLEDVKWLLDNDADALKLNNDKQTALHILASSSKELNEKQKDDRLEIAKLLLGKGVDATQLDGRLKTASTFAEENGFPELGKLMMDHSNAVEAGYYKQVNDVMNVAAADKDRFRDYQAKPLSKEKLAEIQDFCHLADADKESLGAYSLLFYLCSKSLLIDEKAEEVFIERENNLRKFFAKNPDHVSLMPGLLDKERFSPQELQQQEERLMVILTRDLLVSGADIAVLTPTKFSGNVTLINRACDRGNFSMAIELFDAVSEEVRVAEDLCNAADIYGANPLHHSSRYVNELSAVLVERVLRLEELKFDDPDIPGKTPFARAIEENNMPVAGLLLQRGADHNLAHDVLEGASSEVNDFVTQNVATRTIPQPLIIGEFNPLTAEDLRKMAKGYSFRFSDDSNPVIEAVVQDKKGVNQGSLVTVACRYESKLDLQRLINAGTDLTRKDGDFLDPLTFSCASGKAASIQVLLANGARAKDLGEGGATKLHVLCYYAGGDPEERKKIAKYLMDAGVDPTIQNDQGRRASEYAKSKGMLELERGARKLGEGMLELADILQDAERVVNANRRHFVDTVNRLANNASLRYLPEGYEPKILSIEELQAVGKLSGNEVSNPTDLLAVICSRSIAREGMSKKDLENGATIIREFCNSNPRYFTAINGDNDEISLESLMRQEWRLKAMLGKDLIASGADILVKGMYKDSPDSTPLIESCAMGCFPLARILLDGVKVQGGAKDYLNSRDDTGSAALYYCARFNNDISAQLMVGILGVDGVEADFKVKDQHSPLVAAANINNSRAGKLLLDRGASMEYFGSGAEWSMLHWVCFDGSKEFATELVTHGANCTLESVGKKIPMEFLSFNQENLPLIKLMVENGADVNRLDKDSKSLLPVVCRAGDQDLLNLLFEKEVKIKPADFKAIIADEAINEGIRKSLQTEFTRRREEMAKRIANPSTTTVMTSSSSVVGGGKNKGVERP